MEVNKETICWECSHAGGECTWKCGKPVAGWVTKEITVRYIGKLQKVVRVISCPKFKRDSIRVTQKVLKDMPKEKCARTMAAYKKEAIAYFEKLGIRAYFAQDDV